ncbi:PP2C family protein-serine/threonine phosphatase [Alkalilacustris brevis]|uniref:PP2C family protein-serine/threonine phosphatase n=1 Tax=Alkalilacustris brevis TaxID=2026338 RepID=UPI000E0D560B|nr:PP2C family protein-serine/threonine phosphatase [Alkalilacustris brevis]
MTLRSALLAILSAFGLALLAFLSMQSWNAYIAYDTAQRAHALDDTRHALLMAVLTLRDDRLRLAADTIGLDRPPTRRPQPGAPIEDALRHIDEARVLLPGAKLADSTYYDTELGREHDTLNALRGATNHTAGRAELSLQIEASAARLLELRMTMLEERGINDLSLALLHLLRNYALHTNHRLTENALNLLPYVKGEETPPEEVFHHHMLRLAAQIGGMTNLLGEVFVFFQSPSVAQATELSAFIRDIYAPAETALVAALMEGNADDIEGAFESWLERKQTADAHVFALFEEIYTASQSRLEGLHRDALNALRTWLALSVLAIAIFLGSAAMIWLLIALPMERIRESMLQLAEGDLTRTPTRHEVMSDLRQMSDALRVFRINAVRRERLQRERLALHARIAEAHAELRSDLEAAAVVQRSQLPAPGIVGAYRFTSLYRPSTMLAGDTYDFMPLPGGGARLFQIDVAGHGAAASLVSVAAHVALKRALEHLPPGGDLAGALETINANWPEELTYFTVLVIELTPETESGRLVQAGHPYPAVLRRDGALTRLGEGGLPVGVLKHADYKEIRFDFAAGDRLLVFTDGIYEATDPDKRIFGEDRLAGLLKAYAGQDTETLVARIDASLQEWSGSDHMDDDISLVVAERV